MIFSCRNKKDAEINSLSIQQDSFKNQIDEKASRIKLINDGNKLRYIIKFRLSQSHFTINIFEHIKDKMNAVDFEIPVDEIFYDSVNIGSKIVNEFRTGSFILNGSFGNWNMNVIDKRIEKEKK